LDRVILHTVMHHSSTSTYIPNFIEIEETFCGRTYGRIYGRADGHLKPALLGRLGGVGLISRPMLKNNMTPIYANPIEVLNDPDFSIVVLHVILYVVVFHVQADVFFHFLVILLRELESALHNKINSMHIT